MRVPSSSHRPFPPYVTWPTREIKIPAPTRARNRGRRHRKLTRPSHEIRISFSRGGRTEKGRRRRRKWKEGDDPRVIFQASPSTTISRMMAYLSKDVSRLKTTNFFFQFLHHKCDWNVYGCGKCVSLDPTGFTVLFIVYHWFDSSNLNFGILMYGISWPSVTRFIRKYKNLCINIYTSDTWLANMKNVTLVPTNDIVYCHISLIQQQRFKIC